MSPDQIKTWNEKIRSLVDDGYSIGYARAKSRNELGFSAKKDGYITQTLEYAKTLQIYMERIGLKPSPNTYKIISKVKVSKKEEVNSNLLPVGVNDFLIQTKLKRKMG